jgi:hypothetical protein
MFATKHCLPYDPTASRHPVTLAAFLLATSSEFSPAGSTPKQRKMNALCFDILTDPFCRKPLVLIFIQFARGVYPLHFILLSFNELQTAPAPQPSLRDLPVRQRGAILNRRRVWAVLAARGNYDPHQRLIRT